MANIKSPTKAQRRWLAKEQHCVICQKSIHAGVPRKYCSRECRIGLVKFLKQVNKTATCWLWAGPRSPKGYGATSYGSAHRRSYELHIGPIPKGKHVLHKCDNPPCVNPDHLFLGTHADNMHDMKLKGRGRSGPKKHQPRGTEIHTAKLTEEDVLLIRELFSAGENSFSLGARFKVTYATVNRIVNRKIWRHL